MTSSITPRGKTHVLPLLLKPRALLRFMLDGRAPKLPKLVLLLGVIYAVLPVDLVPDLVPILGWLDDLGVMTAAMAWLLSAVAKYEDDQAAPKPNP